MQPKIPEPELGVLRRIGFGRPERVLIVGAPLAPIVALVQAKLPRAQLDVVMAEAGDADLAGPRVAVHDSVEVIEAPQLVVWRPTGYEGKARERALIQALANKLEPGAQVLLSTHKRRGAKRVKAMLEELLGPVNLAHRDGSGVQIVSARARGRATPAEPTGRAEPAGEVEVEVEYAGERFAFVTTSSLFSKERLDAGTRLLIERLDSTLDASLDAAGNGRLLDLGCGWGPIAILLARRHPGLQVVLLDKDPVAIEHARRNVSSHGLDARAELVLGPGPQTIAGPAFDVVASHLPLHIPRTELERILTEAHDRLRPGGRLICVALANYDVSPSLHAAFPVVELSLEATTASGLYRIYTATRG